MPVSVTIMAKGEPTPACKTGEVVASIVGSSSYGAGEDQCSQMCAGKNTLQWMAGVAEGSCGDQGYSKMVEQKEVTPAGSPMPVSVTIMAKGEATSYGSSDSASDGDAATTASPDTPGASASTSGSIEA